ncbi:MAG: tRNA uracil 4-sulfurtransferase ThiI [Bacilli bacterium]
MKKIIIIKYGELSTKKDNINFFLKTLKDNIEVTLKSIEHEINYDYGRMFITTDDEHVNSVVEKLKCVFGILEIMVGYQDNDMEFLSIEKNVLELVKEMNFKTFKVITKRSNKKYPLDSMEVSRKVGGFLLDNISNINVDVKTPELKVYLEIRNKEILYYFSGVKGLGGYPVGTLGKGLLMLSGGIDSPVAGYMTIKRGVKLEGIYFESPPHTSDAAKEKVIELSRKLALYNASIKLHIVNFTEIQENILKNIPHDYLITIMRRMMYRISAIIASNNRCHILVNGESIGQVASQTLTSMKCINEVVKIPVIRPLACFDKLEIIKLAEDIDTYKTSILPFEDCCTIFVPDHPIINPSLKKCEEYEKLIDYKNLIYTAIKNHETIKVESVKEIKYNDLL